MKDEKVRIKVRLNEEEHEKLKRCAAACGLSQSEFLRQLCKGRTPKPRPTEEFWKLMDALYDVHSGFQKCVKYELSAAEICTEIEQLILELEEEV